MAGCCAAFPFFFFSFLSQLNRRRGKTQPSALVLDSMTFSGYRAFLISVKSLLRGNAVEDFSTYLRARGVFVIGANVLFAYQENSITPTTGPTTPPYRQMMITGMAESDENTEQQTDNRYIFHFELYGIQPVYFVLADLIPSSPFFWDSFSRCLAVNVKGSMLLHLYQDSCARVCGWCAYGPVKASFDTSCYLPLAQ